MDDSHRQRQHAVGPPRHCPAQDPGNCPPRISVSVSQRRKVVELAARTGVALPSDLEAMTSEQVDTWLAVALARWIAPDGGQSLLGSL